jgi:hypothetical protein
VIAESGIRSTTATQEGRQRHGPVVWHLGGARRRMKMPSNMNANTTISSKANDLGQISHEGQLLIEHSKIYQSHLSKNALFMEILLQIQKCLLNNRLTQLNLLYE